jgi:hypothetical protein
MIDWFTTACCLYGAWGAFKKPRPLLAPSSEGGLGLGLGARHASRATLSHSHFEAPRAMGAGGWGAGCGALWLMGRERLLLARAVQSSPPFPPCAPARRRGGPGGGLGTPGLAPGPRPPRTHLRGESRSQPRREAGSAAAPKPALLLTGRGCAWVNQVLHVRYSELLDRGCCS